MSITPSGNVGIGGSIANISSTLYVDGDVTATNIPMGDYANMQYNTSNGKFYYDNSFARHKENITNLHVDFNTILAARPVQYTRPGTPGRIEIGYIAEEMEALGLLQLIGYDKEGLVENFNYEKMILYVVEVLKDQNKTIENQLEVNAQLQQKINNQQAQIDQILALLEGKIKE